MFIRAPKLGGGTSVSICKPVGVICTATSSARAPGKATTTCSSEPSAKMSAGGSHTGRVEGRVSSSKKLRCLRSASSSRAQASAHIQDFLRLVFIAEINAAGGAEVQGAQEVGGMRYTAHAAVHAATHHAGPGPAARRRTNQCGGRGRLCSARRALIHDPHRIATGLLVRAQGEQA